MQCVCFALANALTAIGAEQIVCARVLTFRNNNQKHCKRFLSNVVQPPPTRAQLSIITVAGLARMRPTADEVNNVDRRTVLGAAPTFSP